MKKSKQIPEEIIEELRDIYKTEYGVKLTTDEARDRAKKMLKLFCLLSNLQNKTN